TKFVPVTWTDVPPVAGPELGAISATVGAGPPAMTEKIAEGLVLDCSSGLVTVTEYEPNADPTVETLTVTDVGLVKVTLLTVTLGIEACSRFANPAPGSTKPE